MRYTICLAIVALFLCGICSCDKSATAPQSYPLPADSALSINLTYPNPDTADFGTSFELIISEPGG
jgi:hypothetical protein